MAIHGANPAQHSAPNAVELAPDEPRPGWFVARGNGTYVALIALDDMPDNIHFLHVPRYLTACETSGMEFLGNYPSSGLKHRAVLVPDAFDIASPDAGARDVSKAARALPRLATSMPASNGPLQVHPTRPKGLGPLANEASAAQPDGGFDKRSSATVRPLPPSGREPEQSKKEYCSHWIRTGECDFMQQGCIYKHVMPDLATLKKIGFRGIPGWWQKLHGRRGRERPERVAAETKGPQTPKSSRSTSTQSGSTDTGSLHLGNPDSQRFLRSKLRRLSRESKYSARTKAKSEFAASGSSSSPKTRDRSPSPEDELRLVNAMMPALLPQAPQEQRKTHEPATALIDDLFLVSPSELHKPRFTRAIFNPDARGGKGTGSSGVHRRGTHKGGSQGIASQGVRGQNAGGQGTRGGRKARAWRGDRQQKPKQA